MIAIGEDKLNLVTSTNLVDRLAGLIPGLNITTSNAEPGKDQSLRIRGNNSLSANNTPLVVLNGIPYNGSLGDIDPDNVESMSVLKDASAAAIYGSRGSNGVILIQTKKGEGKAKVTYKGQVGLQEPAHRLDMMKGAEYVQYLRDFQYLRGRDFADPSKSISYESLTPDVVLGADEYANYQAGRELDWQDIIFRQALTTNHQVSILGSTERTSYIASVSHSIQDGVVRNTGLKRTNVSLNLTQDLNDWLKIGVNLQGVRRDYGGVTPSIESGLKMSPYANNVDADGNRVFVSMQRNTLFINPMANVAAVRDKINHNVILSSFAEIIFPVKGLKYRTNFGYNYRNEFEGTYYGRDTNTGQTKNGSASITNKQYWDYTWENLVTYNREFGVHKVDLTGLFSMAQTHTQEAVQKAESFVSDASAYNQMAAGEKNKSVTSKLTETALLSYMLRANYSLAGRYMLTLTGRSDGYSAFGKNNKYAFFPSAAVAWNIASEEFLEEQRTSWLDMLKLRVSYGANGNQAINAYQTLDRLSNVRYIWGDGESTANGFYMNYNGKGNPNLKWETTYTFNVGLDFSLFNGRLSGDINYYVANTKDLLMTRTVPIMNGFRSILDNIGQTRNQGVEINLNSVNIRNKDFAWNTNFNFSLNRDKIVRLADGVDADITNKWFVGEPARVYYDYNMVGVWQQNDPRWKNVGGKWGYFTEVKDGDQMKTVEIQAGAKPGSAQLEDVDGDGIISDKDRKIIGSRVPSFVMGMTNSFSYKDFYASVVFYGLFGQWRQMHDENFDRWMPDYNYLSGMNYWTESNPTNTMTSPDYVPYQKHSFYKRMNYVQLKNLTIGYNLPKSALNAIGLTAVRFDISLNNLFSISNFRNALNYDNTAEDEKAAVVAYPTTRSYTFGLGITF
jgi:TonB-linked SusC/RagA family outer membrane protein